MAGRRHGREREANFRIAIIYSPVVVLLHDTALQSGHLTASTLSVTFGPYRCAYN